MNKKQRNYAIIITILFHILIALIYVRFSFRPGHFILFRTKTKQPTHKFDSKKDTTVFFDNAPIKAPPPQIKSQPIHEKPKLAEQPKLKNTLRAQAQLRAAKPTKKLQSKDKKIPMRFEKQEATSTKKETKAEKPQKRVALASKETAPTPKEKPIEQTITSEIKKKQSLDKTSFIKTSTLTSPVLINPIKTTQKLSAQEIKSSALKNLLKQPQKKTSSKTGNIIDVPDYAQKSFFEQTSLLLESYDNGNSVINRDGDPNLIPTLEDMKYICYEQQIHDQLINEWKILYSHNQHININPSRPTGYSFEIEKDGTICNLCIIESSGCSIFDDMVINSVKSASPFPPIPNHFGVSRYKPRGMRITVPL